MLEIPEGFLETENKKLHLENQVKFSGWISDKNSFFESIKIMDLVRMIIENKNS